MLRNVFNVDRKLSTWKTVVIFNSIHAYKRGSFDVCLNCVKYNITMPGWFLFETCCRQYIFEEILLMSMPKYEDGIKTCDSFIDLP